MAIYIFKTVPGVCQRSVQKSLHYLQFSQLEAEYDRLLYFVLLFCYVALIIFPAF